MTKMIDRTGHRYGRLTVIARDQEKARNIKWLCICDCGERVSVTAVNLNSGASKSCGCLRKEIMSATKGTHRGSGSDEYKIRLGMIKRCENVNSRSFKNYGARGIKVCDRWKGTDGHANFLADVGRRPSPAHSIERIDNEGNYEPNNVRWATYVDQARNRRVRRNAATGITGVNYRSDVSKYAAHICMDGITKHLIFTTDFFEACCARKAAENEYWRSAA